MMSKHRKTAGDLIKEGLKAMGADGLCSCECGCGVDDLFLCADNPTGCVPAKRITITEKEIEDYGIDPDDIGEDMYIPLDIPTEVL